MSSHLPSLSESRILRLFSVTALYMAQGIGMGVVVVALPAFMAAQDLGVGTISGYMGAVMSPWALKFLFAPFMDRFTVLSLGRRRPWVLFGILFAACGYLCMALVDQPFEHLGLFLIAGMLSTGGTAIMDVAVDGMVVEIAPREEHAQANGLMWGGKVLGTAIFAWAAGWLFQKEGVAVTCLAAALATVGFGIIPLFFRERPGEKLLPWSTGKPSKEALSLQQDSWQAIGRNLRKVIGLKASAILVGLILLIGAIQGLFDALLPVISVQELGWGADNYSTISGVSQLIAGLLGMVLGGYLVNRWGHKRALFSFLIVLAVSSITMGALPDFWENNNVTMGYMFIHHLSRTLALITCFSVGMALCWKQVAASQFAFYLAFGNLGVSSGSFLLGALSQRLSYPQIFFVLALITGLALLVVKQLDIRAHQDRVNSLTD